MGKRWATGDHLSTLPYISVRCHATGHLVASLTGSTNGQWATDFKAQVVQSLPHHAEYGRSGAEREFLRRNIGRYEWASAVCRKAQVRSREGVPAFCMIPIIHSVQYIFAILD